MSRYGRVWLLLAALGTFLQGQHSSIELAAGWASPSSDLTQYARPGAFLELHVGDAPLPARWDWPIHGLNHAGFSGRPVFPVAGPPRREPAEVMVYPGAADVFEVWFDRFLPSERVYE